MEYLVTQPAKAGGKPCPAEEAGPNHQQERFFQLSKKSAVVIGIAVFIIAIAAVIEIARIPMPL